MYNVSQTIGTCGLEANDSLGRWNVHEDDGNCCAASTRSFVPALPIALPFFMVLAFHADTSLRLEERNLHTLISLTVQA